MSINLGDLHKEKKINELKQQLKVFNTMAKPDLKARAEIVKELDSLR